MCVEVACECDVDISIGATFNPYAQSPIKTPQMGNRIGGSEITIENIVKRWQIEQNFVKKGSVMGNRGWHSIGATLN